MSDVAIRAESLSKEYPLVERQEGYRTLREAITRAAGQPLRRMKRLFSRERHNTLAASRFWALHDVSLEVRRGEVLGIIGRNGAGKSTLLKVLSRITAPTAGRAILKGRVGSLLEVGTGFHPELTGRENIYLNGAILGMKRLEIDRKFDEIVAFAEVERFIDSAVKHYSSGMYLRLAFAVAAHLELEILLVDEVLAVGDTAFQKKCMGKMSDAAYQGRTVLLVSHNMAAIHVLAKRCIVISEGRLVHEGSVAEAVTVYTRDLSGPATSGNGVALRSGTFRFKHPTDRRWDVTQAFYAEWDVTLPRETTSAILWSILTDSNGIRLVQEAGTFRDISEAETATKIWTVGVRYPPVWLKPGIYNLQLRLFPNGLGKNHRYLSEPVPLELITWKTDVADTALTPQINWTIHSSAAVTPSVAVTGSFWPET